MARSVIADNIPLIGVGVGLGVLLTMGLASLSRARNPPVPAIPPPKVGGLFPTVNRDQLTVGAVSTITCDEAWLTHRFVMPNGATITGPNLIDQGLRNPLNVDVMYAVHWAANALEAAGCGTWVPALRNVEIYMRGSQVRAQAQAAARIAEIARQAPQSRARRSFRSRIR